MKQTSKKRKHVRAAVICLAVVVVLIAAAAAVYYTKIHALTLNGDEAVEVGWYGTYQEMGATALDGGSDVSDKVKIDSRVNLSAPGTYKVTYTYGDLSVERDVTVTDKMNPKLTLKGEQTVSQKLGEAYKETGFTATDEKGNDISSRVRVGNTSFKRAGTFQVAYTVNDGAGNSTTVNREVRVLPNTDYEAKGLPICMYHYVYDEENPPEDLYKRFGNYIGARALGEELDYLVENNYYFPTWREVRDYVDGKLLLPEKSIVLCFDDGALNFMENGIPVLEQHKVPASSFVITSERGRMKVKTFKSPYVSFQSHSHNMHRDGGTIGHGGIFPVLPREEALADLKKSIEICGNGDAFAYPYGDYTQECRNIVEEAGFLCAVTTEGGKAKPGDDPLLLPRVRMSLGQSLNNFIGRIQI